MAGEQQYNDDAHKQVCVSGKVGLLQFTVAWRSANTILTLQRVQKNAITGSFFKRQRDPMHGQLHWLPVHQRINYELAVMN